MRRLKIWCGLQAGILFMTLLIGAFLGCGLKCCTDFPTNRLTLSSCHEDESESHHFCTALGCCQGISFVFQKGLFSFPVRGFERHFQVEGRFHLPLIFEEIFRPPIAPIAS